MIKSCLEKFLNVSINKDRKIMKYLVKTLSAWTTFEDLILNESELKEYKEYAKEQQLLLEVSDYEY